MWFQPIGAGSGTSGGYQSGYPQPRPATTVNKVCSSGAKATMFGAQSIMLAQRRRRRGGWRA